jgi:RNA polymerase sigma-70 factor (ECF subfamily)
MSDSPATRPTLLARVRDPRDQAAWTELAEIYMPFITGHLRRRGLQPADADDVAQNVLLAIAGAIQRFEYDPRKGSFRGWLLTVTRNKLIDHFQRRRREPRASSDTALDSLLEAQPSREEEDVWEKEYREHLFAWACAKVQKDFQDTTWQAFWRSTVGEEEPQAVAKSLGMTVQAVYIARSRVTASLREKILEVAGE